MQFSWAVVVTRRCRVAVFERPEVIDKTGWGAQQHTISHDAGMIDTADLLGLHHCMHETVPIIQFASTIVTGHTVAIHCHRPHCCYTLSQATLSLYIVPGHTVAIHFHRPHCRYTFSQATLSLYIVTGRPVAIHCRRPHCCNSLSQASLLPFIVPGHTAAIHCQRPHCCHSLSQATLMPFIVPGHTVAIHSPRLHCCHSLPKPAHQLFINDYDYDIKYLLNNSHLITYFIVISKV